MGGNTRQLQNTSQSQTTSGQQQQQQQQQLNPYEPATGVLKGILGNVGSMQTSLTGNERGALDSLAARGQAGNPFASSIGGVATEMLGGGPDRTGMVNNAYAQYSSALDPTARGDYLDPSKNPFFAGTTAAIGDDVVSRLNAQYAASGRAPMGAGSFAGQAGEGIGRATAPIYAGIYNSERDRQLGAQGNQFGAGMTATGLLSQLDQNRFANMGAGIGAAGSAWDASNAGDMQVLNAEAQRRGIPVSALAAQMGLTLPVAQAFGSQTGSSSGTSSGSAFGTGTTTQETQVPLADKIAGYAALALGGYGKLR